MKTIIDPVKGENAGVFMGRLEMGQAVDNESVKVMMPFYIGVDYDTAKCFYIRGRLNVVENIFHADAESEETIETYFSGFENFDVQEAVEQR